MVPHNFQHSHLAIKAKWESGTILGDEIVSISVLLPYQNRHLQLKVQTIKIIFTNNFQQLHLLIMHFQHLAIKAKPHYGTTILGDEIVSISVHQRTYNPIASSDL